MKTILIFFSVLLMFIQTKAQDTLTGPHGGRIKVASRYKIETLGCDNFLEVYLFNEESEPIFNHGINGKVSFFYDKKNQIYPLQPYGIDGFTCKITSPDFSHYEVSLNLLDKIHISASFNECVVPKR